MKYTVYHLQPYGGGTTLIWDGPEFGKALAAALDRADGGELAPLDHTHVAALRKFPGRPVSAWTVPAYDDPEGKAILFVMATPDEVLAA